MAAVRRGLQELLEKEDKPEKREQFALLIAQTETQEADADELVEAGSGQPPDQAFRLAAGHAALEGDVEDAHMEAGEDKETLFGKIKRWLKRAGEKLWAMISRLTKIKEWSLTGTMGTGVLGFAQASISVTFGTADDAGTAAGIPGRRRKSRRD